MRILAPGLWLYSINWTLTAWLQAMGMADVPAFAAGVGLSLHIPFNLLFIHGLKLGYLGCAVATVAFQLVQPFLIVAYLFRTSHGTQRLLQSALASTIGRTRLSFWKEAKLAVQSMRGICRYLSLAVPGIVLVSEWWASELSCFLSGRLQPRPALALDGMTLYQSINSFLFMFPVSCSVAGAARVGSLLGQGDSEGAAFASKISVLCALIVSGSIGLFLFYTPHTLLPSLFTKEQEVIQETSRTITILSLYVVADGIEVAVNGTIKGCGRQCITMPVVLFAYWIVGVPLAYYIAFTRNGGFMCEDKYLCGDLGLVFG
jgi:MATE family multidrug resistance protein